MSIEDKIAAYLKQQQKKARSPQEAENIAQVASEVENSGGECVGLSVSWAYSKKTRVEAESSGSGLSFFNRINGLLLDWDGIKEFSKEEQHNIDRFIENVIYYQRAQDQNYVPGGTDFHQRQHARQNFKLLESETDSKGRKFSHSYQTDYLYLSKKLLEDRLAKVIMPETMTFLTFVIDKNDNKANSSFVDIAEGSTGHMVSVYHNIDDNQYYYYNSNNGKELVFSNIKDLASKVWDDSAKSRFDKGFPKTHITDFILRKLRVDVMQFTHETRNQYPKLLDLTPSLKETTDFLEKDGKVVLNFLNDPMVKRYFLSLNKDCQLEFLDKVEDEDENANAKKNLIKLLMDNVLKINNFNEQIVDPAIIPDLLSKYESIIDLLVKEKQLNQSMVEELSAGFLSGAINRISSTLEEALQNGALDKVQYLFAIGAKLDSGSLAVMEMIKNGNMPILSYLVQEKHLDLYQFKTVTYHSTEYPPKITTDKFNCDSHPIIFAARKGSKEILKFLVENLDPSKKGENSKILNEALYWTCLEGKLDKAEFLLQKGANPYVVAGINHNIIYDDKYHSTPQNALEAACRSRNSLELITKLLQHKADISQYRTLGFLCESHKSIFDSHKRYKAAALLLENGASPNVKADYIKNPLLVACELLDVELVTLLLQYGANPNSEIDTRFSFKDTALVVACRQYTHEKHKNPEDNPKYQIAKLLLENGANPAPNKQGLNPIDYINEENDVGLKELINTKQISVPEKLKKAPASLIANASATKVEKDQFRTK